jgi:hypothetical protein
MNGASGLDVPPALCSALLGRLGRGPSSSRRSERPTHLPLGGECGRVALTSKTPGVCSLCFMGDGAHTCAGAARAFCSETVLVAATSALMAGACARGTTPPSVKRGHSALPPGAPVGPARGVPIGPSLAVVVSARGRVSCAVCCQAVDPRGGVASSHSFTGLRDRARGLRRCAGLFTLVVCTMRAATAPAWLGAAARGFESRVASGPAGRGATLARLSALLGRAGASSRARASAREFVTVLPALSLRLFGGGSSSASLRLFGGRSSSPSRASIGTPRRSSRGAPAAARRGPRTPLTPCR